MKNDPTKDLLDASIKRSRGATIVLDFILFVAFCTLPLVTTNLRIEHPAARTASDTAMLNQIARETTEELLLIELNELNLSETLLWKHLSDWLSEYNPRSGQCSLRPNANQHIDLQCLAYASQQDPPGPLTFQSALTVFTYPAPNQNSRSDASETSENCPLSGNKAATPKGLYIGDSARRTFDAKQKLWLPKSTTK